MNAVATIEPRRSILMETAHSYGMEPDAFEATLRATVFPVNASREQFAAFVLVANQYKLNPILKEIYAFPAKGGGIVPIVSIDGWMNLINSHPKFDGMDFEDTHDSGGKLVCVRCTIYRKDRSHPVSVTEYLSECKRNTDPWKMEHRMLRHKAAIQCARYAFGFAGIYDEDEGEKIAEARDITPPAVPRVPPPAPPREPPAAARPAEKAKDPDAPAQATTRPAGGDNEASAPSLETQEPEKHVTYAQNATKFLERFDARCAEAKDGEELVEIWMQMIDGISGDMLPPDYEQAAAIYAKHEGRIEP